VAIKGLTWTAPGRWRRGHGLRDGLPAASSCGTFGRSVLPRCHPVMSCRLISIIGIAVVQAVLFALVRMMLVGSFSVPQTTASADAVS
jgi:hypothetical protein